MTQLIEIENGIARIVDRTVSSEVPLADLMPQLETRRPTYLPIMPDHARVAAFDPESGRGGFLMELAPAVRHLRIDNEGDDVNEDDDQERFENATERNEGAIAVFHLQFPWHYFFYSFRIGHDGEDWNDGRLVDFTIDHSLFFFRPDRLKSLEDRLWTGTIPNVDGGAAICWGYTRHETASLHERINDMIKNFTSTIFNYHLGAPRPPDYGSYTEWEKAGLANPLIYREWQMFTQGTGLLSVQQLFAQNVEALPAPMDFTNSHIIIPEPPPMFTVARALEWMENLPEHSRERFLHALRRHTDEHPKEEKPSATEASTEPGGADRAPDPTREPDALPAPRRRARRTTAQPR